MTAVTGCKYDDVIMNTPCSNCVTMLATCLAAGLPRSTRASGSMRAVARAPSAAVGLMHAALEATRMSTVSAGMSAGRALSWVADSLHNDASGGGGPTTTRTLAAVLSASRCAWVCCKTLQRASSSWQYKCTVAGRQVVTLGRLSRASNRKGGRCVVTVLHSFGTPVDVMCMLLGVRCAYHTVRRSVLKQSR